jgi:hypothetical protein
MATQADVRRIALALPDVTEAADRFAFDVMHKGKGRGIAWVWLERIEPKKARVPNPSVIAIRVANVAQRDVMIATEPDKFFTEPHYNNFPAVLVRLAAVSRADLKTLLAEACRLLAPPPRTAARKRSTG